MSTITDIALKIATGITIDDSVINAKLRGKFKDPMYRLLQRYLFIHQYLKPGSNLRMKWAAYMDPITESMLEMWSEDTDEGEEAPVDILWENWDDELPNHVDKVDIVNKLYNSHLRPVAIQYVWQEMFGGIMFPNNVVAIADRLHPELRPIFKLSFIHVNLPRYNMYVMKVFPDVQDMLHVLPEWNKTKRSNKYIQGHETYVNTVYCIQDADGVVCKINPSHHLSGLPGSSKTIDIYKVPYSHATNPFKWMWDVDEPNGRVSNPSIDLSNYQYTTYDITASRNNMIGRISLVNSFESDAYMVTTSPVVKSMIGHIYTAQYE